MKETAVPQPSFSLCLALVFALPVFAHAPALLGIFAADPIYQFGGLGHFQAGIVPGNATIDPNWAGIDQALTATAMHALLSGQLPWWNPFEGFGAPLAGEMQCSALFPFSLLIALPNGPLLLNTLMSVAAGIGMLLLLRHLRLNHWAALAGAVTFEMCGTFAWLSGSWSYSIPWLPFLVLGIELCRSTDPKRSRQGIIVTAVSIALLLYCGFIETSYLEGLVAVLWSCTRLAGAPSVPRLVFARRLIVAAVIGLGLGAPILTAFRDTLLISAVGLHANGYPGTTLAQSGMMQKLVPYIYGPIFASKQQPMADLWGNTGGYVAFALPVFALAGAFGRRHLSIRITCSAAIVFGFSAIFGGPLQSILLLVPGVKFTAFYRYSDPSIAFAASVLAAMALDDFEKNSARIRTRLVGALIAIVALVFATMIVSEPQLLGSTAVSADSDLLIWHLLSLLAVAGCAIAIAFAIAARTRASIVISALTLCVESTVFLIVPTLSAPVGATIDLHGIDFLRTNLGQQRFFSLGPILPNYGSYFGIADLDYADVPLPSRTAAYIAEHLDSKANATDFYAGVRPEPAQTSTFARNESAYADVGVKYVLVPLNAPPPAPFLRARFRDSVMTIYELPNAQPYFSAPGCTIVSDSRTALTADCRSRSNLCRLELNAPGWTATVSGKREEPSDCKEIFQSVALPRGRSSIKFDYTPPGMPVAFVFFISSAAAVGLLCSPVRFAGVRRRDRLA